MRLKPLAILSVLALALAAGPAHAKAPAFFGWGGEKTVKAVTFPSTPEFSVQGKHFDPGACFKQVTVLFMPVWNYDVRWCGVIENDPSRYLSIGRAEFATLAKPLNIDLPADPPIPLWDLLGGKLAVALVIAGFAGFSIAKKRSA